MKKYFPAILIVLLLSIYPAVLIIRKNAPIPDNAVSLEFPLKGGKFLIIQSGRYGEIHKSPTEKYALDIIKEGKLNIKFKKSSIEDSEIYEDTVYSPCYGYIKDLGDGISDQPLGTRGSGGGNYIIVGCDGFDVYMAHLKKGSFNVGIGDVVNSGDKLANVGNSGNTDAPHLHIMAYKTEENSDEKIPVPMIFNGRYLYKYDIVEN